MKKETKNQVTAALPKVDVKKNLWGLLICVLIIFISAALAFQVETDFGKVSVTSIKFATADGNVMAAKLYRPTGATADNKLAGVLALHGYQNDKEVAAPAALELARRNFVVLAIDHLGHGDSTGYMDWNTASGAQYGYDYLKTLPYVDTSNLGIFGHSMGAMNTVALGQLNPDVKALNPQCGPAGDPSLKNLLLTQAKYEEFMGFRENQLVVEPLKNNDARVKAFGLPQGPVDWNTTYGSFTDGTARRADLVSTVHPGVTFNSQAIAGTIDWFAQALQNGQQPTIPSNQQIFWWKEIFMLIALLTSMVSTIFLLNLLLSFAFFAPIAGPLPTKHIATGWKWWWPAILNIVIAGVTYPPLTALGGIGGKLNGIFPFLKAEMASGVALWFLVNAVIFVILFTFWYRGAKKNGVNMYDLGVAFDENNPHISWPLIGKTALVALILFGWMYLLVAISQGVWGIEFRFIWSFARTFPTMQRFGQFWLYLIPALAFFFLNAGLFLFGEIRQKVYETPAKTQIIWWLKNALTGLGGLIIVWCVQYLPYFFGAGPGFELLGKPTWSEMWPLMLFVFIPEFLVILYFVTHYYRKTGKIYLGAMMGAILAIWFSIAGTVIIK